MENMGTKSQTFSSRHRPIVNSSTIGIKGTASPERLMKIFDITSSNTNNQSSQTKMISTGIINDPDENDIIDVTIAEAAVPIRAHVEENDLLASSIVSIHLMSIIFILCNRIIVSFPCIYIYELLFIQNIVIY